MCSLARPFAAVLLASACLATTAARPQPVTIGAVFSLTGPGASVGVPVAEAVRLAVDDANADGGAPITLDLRDDRSDDDAAREQAQALAATEAVAVVGPGRTTSSLAAGPVFAQAGLASIVPYAHGAGGGASTTTFRPVFGMPQMGQGMADYLALVLGGKAAVVLYRDNGYGRPFADGFRDAASRRGLQVTAQTFTTADELAALATQAAAMADHPAIVLGMIDPDAAPALVALARQGLKPLVLGTSAIATDTMAEWFAKLPEFQRDPGFFTEGVYAVAPLIPDSANADALAFLTRFQARFGHAPRWESAQGYDAARLAISAARAAAGTDRQARRAAVRDYLAAIDSPAVAVPSLTGPLWFGAGRGRQQAIRAGRFHNARFESAPVQLVPVSQPTAADIASGTLIDLGNGAFARKQMVVYTGVYLNEVPRIDIAQSTFTADFYVWIRSAPGAVNAADLDFPDMTRGSFAADKPSVERKLDDGTTYRLWRVRGDFKNDYDLHHYPMDRQSLLLRFFNARAGADSVVYVQDRRMSGPDGAAGGAAASPDAFRNLTQWDARTATANRDVQVTRSGLGDPTLTSAEQQRELSGYRVSVDVRRRTAVTLAKTLLPLLMMTFIMFAALFFPQGLVKEKITVAITGALSGAVLLTSVNSALGGVGYTVAGEYAFYLFFGLCLLSILSVLAAENFRVAKKPRSARMVEVTTRWLYATSVLAVAVTGAVMDARW